MIKKKRVIDFVKIGENTNIVKLSSAYDTNCSMQEFETVDDRTLQCMLDSEREMDSFQRNERNHVVSLPEDEVKAAKMGAVTVSVEEKFFLNMTLSRLMRYWMYSVSLHTVREREFT